MRNLNNPKYWKIVAAIVGLSTVGFIILPSITTIIPTRQVGLINTFGQMSDKVLQPGFHLKSPTG